MKKYLLLFSLLFTSFIFASDVRRVVSAPAGINMQEVDEEARSSFLQSKIKRRIEKVADKRACSAFIVLLNAIVINYKTSMRHKTLEKLDRVVNKRLEYERSQTPAHEEAEFPGRVHFISDSELPSRALSPSSLWEGEVVEEVREFSTPALTSKQEFLRYEKKEKNLLKSIKTCSRRIAELIEEEEDASKEVKLKQDYEGKLKQVEQLKDYYDLLWTIEKKAEEKNNLKDRWPEEQEKILGEFKREASQLHNVLFGSSDSY